MLRAQLNEFITIEIPILDNYKYFNKDEVGNSGILNNNRFRNSLPTSNWILWNKKRLTYMNKITVSNEPKVQVSIPDHIVRARQESEQFMTPEMNKKYYGHMTNSDSFKGQSKSRIQRANITNYLTVEHWKMLVMYWNLKVFIVFRWIGSILSVLAFLMTICFLSVENWASYNDGTLFYLLLYFDLICEI